jgi:arylsulfatase A-like enzyme
VRRTLCTGKRVFPFEDTPQPKGLYVKRRGWRPLRESDVTVAEALRGQGCVTGLTADTYHLFKPTMNFHRGFDCWQWIRGQEYDMYKSQPLEGVELSKYVKPGMNTRVLEQYFKNAVERKGEEDYQAPKVFQAAMNWLEENYRHEKFFLWIDSFDPHEPWDPPNYYVDMYDPGYQGVEIIYPAGVKVSQLTPEELKHMRALYAGEVTMVDRWFGRFMDKVRELGLDENTVIVFMSDHGKIHGEHGVIGMASQHVYTELYNIPLIIRHPEGEGAGKLISALAYNYDLIPTIFNLIGAEPPANLDGLDLWPLVTGEKTKLREHLICAHDEYVSVWTHKWLYAQGPETWGCHLYDLERDPDQKVDVAGDLPDITTMMQGEIRRFLSRN